MKKTERTTTAERAGRWFGRAWRGFIRQEARAVQWLAGKGLPVAVARLLLWIVKLAVLGALLYVAFWLALLLLFAIAAAWAARNADHDEPEEWAIGEQAEYKNNPGYHPAFHDDAPDPRYSDPRYDDE